MTALEDRGTAEAACHDSADGKLRGCGAEPGQACTRTTGKGDAAKTVKLAHPHAARMAALGAAIAAAAKPAGQPGNGRAPRAAAKPAVPMFDHCARCGMRYAKPWSQDWCGSERACNRRKAVVAAEAELGIVPVTVFNQGLHRLPQQVKEAEQRIAGVRAEREQADGDDGDDDDEGKEDASAA